MIHAQFETPYYKFDAFAETESEAINLLRRAWRHHARQTGADPDYLHNYIDDICFNEISAGCVFRDRSPFTPK